MKLYDVVCVNVVNLLIHYDYIQIDEILTNAHNTKILGQLFCNVSYIATILLSIPDTGNINQ